MAVRVVVHEDVPTLRKEAMKHYNNWCDTRKTEQTNLEEILGVCHRFHMANDPVLAVIRLAPPNLGAGIVTHECAHAAVHLWQVQTMWDPKQSLVCENDEWFCWVLGDLVRETVNQFHERGFYDG